MHPHGDKEDFTCQDMGTLSIGDEVEVMEEEEEEAGLSEITIERDSGGGRGRISNGNGRSREMFQRTVENNRQEGDWSIPTHIEERNDT